MNNKNIIPNKLLMAEARKTLHKKWSLCIGTVILYLLIDISARTTPISGGLISLLATGPFTLGWAIFFLSLSRNQKTKMTHLFLGFQKLGPAIGTLFLQFIFIFLWSLLLIIPGIIAAIAYSQAYFIMADKDNAGPLEVITESKLMMKGFKWKYFCLLLRFAGWFILCIITLGIGFLWLIPYVMTSFAQFYNDIKDVPIKLQNTQATN